MLGCRRIARLEDRIWRTPQPKTVQSSASGFFSTDHGSAGGSDCGTCGIVSLSRGQSCSLHADLVETFGGTSEAKDEGMLDSALAAPYASFGGTAVFSTLLSGAARLGFGLVANHPFFDGNKRIGIHVMPVLLALNGVEILVDNDELVLGWSGSCGRKMGIEELADWI